MKGSDAEMTNFVLHLDLLGVPYFMLREMSFLTTAYHPNIISVAMTNLMDSQLHVIMPFVEHTLLDYIAPPSSNWAPSKRFSSLERCSIMYQLLKGKI